MTQASVAQRVQSASVSLARTKSYNVWSFSDRQRRNVGSIRRTKREQLAGTVVIAGERLDIREPAFFSSGKQLRDST